MYENLSDILKQIALGEDSVMELKAVEFNGNKIAGPHRDGMADELAAMASTATGIIVLGVDDKTRRTQGIPPEKLDIVEGWLRSICNDSIDPPLDVTDHPPPRIQGARTMSQ
ncbi:MAG: ATP-binding protein [Gammaproteobacteria bacterium]|nr:ATP-binding protein [Gammaproteobacteria bacterium]MBU1655804.1 ATP-binding protein [Gammaproteobacteria bacterium]MBU1962089.1 ATP-binding protein [Gammaproteobacteria bacterium]